MTMELILLVNVRTTRSTTKPRALSSLSSLPEQLSGTNVDVAEASKLNNKCALGDSHGGTCMYVALLKCAGGESLIIPLGHDWLALYRLHTEQASGRR